MLHYDALLGTQPWLAVSYHLVLFWRKPWMVFSVAGVSKSTLTLLPLFSSLLILPTICGTMKKKKKDTEPMNWENCQSKRQAITELAFSEPAKLLILSIRKKTKTKPKESQNNLILGNYWRKRTWRTQCLGIYFRLGIHFIWKHPDIWSYFLKSTSAADPSLSHLLLHGQKSL